MKQTKTFWLSRDKDDDVAFLYSLHNKKPIIKNGIYTNSLTSFCAKDFLIFFPKIKLRKGQVKKVRITVETVEK